MEPQPLFEDGAQLFLAHGGRGRMAGDVPKILVAELLAGAIELDELARPHQLDAFDRRRRADHEAVPDAARRGLRIETRRAEQAGSQQRAQLRGERHDQPSPDRRIARHRAA